MTTKRLWSYMIPAVFLAALAATAQQEEPARPSPGSRSYGIPLQPSANPDDLKFFADSVQHAGGDSVILKGHAEIRHRGVRIQADRMVFHSNSGDVETEGKVRINLAGR